MRDKLFDGYGPLASLSAKSDIAFALGIVDKATHSKLAVVRKVRNKFAHSASIITFEQIDIAALLAPLKVPDASNADERVFYLSVVRSVSMTLRHLAS